MITKTVNYDVAVLGGGTSGAIAAIAAARNGAATLLVERNEFLGGTMASGLGLLGFQDRGGRAVVGGIAQELIDALAETGDTLGHNYCPILNSLTPVNAAMMQLRLMEMCSEAGVKLLLCCETSAVTVEDGRLSRVWATGKNHAYDIRARVFVDATGNGDVCAAAGVPFVKGSEAGEIQPGSLIFSLSGVEREPLLDYVERHPEEARSPEGYETETSVDFYRHARGYNFLGLDGVIRRARADGEYRDIPRDRFSAITSPLPDCMIINNTRVTHFDGSSLAQLTEGTLEGYRQMSELLRFIPRYIPGYEYSRLASVSPVMGVRESRRCIGEKTLRYHEVLEGAVPRDTVALCGYNTDIHHGNDESSELYVLKRPYGIPFGTMFNRKVGNLLFTGRLISTDWESFASCRVMGPCMAMGQAAGTAAALCAGGGVDPAGLSTERLRTRLREQNAILEA
jgi:hypothetical protein